MLVDVDAAMAWVWQHISRYGGDRERVVLGGQSAGAHLTALTLLTHCQVRVRVRVRVRVAYGGMA